MTTNQNKPALTIRDGAIKATIWKNTSEKGTFCSVQFSRTYRDEAGNFHNTDSFSGTDLLKLAFVAQKAYENAAAIREQAEITGEGA